MRGKEIALIPQSVNYLDPLMRVGHQILVPQKADGGKKARWKKTREILERYHLEHEVLKYFPFQLSGGMSRRVLVSTSAASKAKLIIADEPTPGMDQMSIDETIRLFRELADQGAGIILITHDIEMALKTANRVAVFLDGTVAETAPVEAFCDQGEALNHAFSRALYLAFPQNGFFKTLTFL